MYTKTQIQNTINKAFNNPQFFVKENGDLTMSLEGEFVDHTWKAGTFLNK